MCLMLIKYIPNQQSETQEKFAFLLHSVPLLPEKYQEMPQSKELQYRTVMGPEEVGVIPAFHKVNPGIGSI